MKIKLCIGFVILLFLTGCHETQNSQDFLVSHPEISYKINGGDIYDRYNNPYKSCVFECRYKTLTAYIDNVEQDLIILERGYNRIGNTKYYVKPY